MSDYWMIRGAVESFLNELKSIQFEVTTSERTASLIERFGQTMTVSAVARQLSCSRPKIYRMIEDGRLNTICGGRIETRSLAKYLEDSVNEDHRARLLRKDSRRCPPPQRLKQMVNRNSRP